MKWNEVGSHLTIQQMRGAIVELRDVTPLQEAQENVFTPVAPIHHMANRPGIFQSQLSWHTGEHCTNDENMSIFIPDPFTLLTPLRTHTGFKCPLNRLRVSRGEARPSSHSRHLADFIPARPPGSARQCDDRRIPPLPALCYKGGEGGAPAKILGVKPSRLSAFCAAFRLSGLLVLLAIIPSRSLQTNRSGPPSGLPR